MDAQRVYLDTNALIAILEKTGDLDEAQRDFVETIDEGGIEAVTSELTEAECLVKPAGAGVKLPDAIHVASAHLGGCEVFISNDRRLASACPMEFKLWSEMGQA